MAFWTQKIANGSGGNAVLLDGSNTGSPVIGAILWFNGSSWTEFPRGVGYLSNDNSGNLQWAPISAPVTQTSTTILWIDSNYTGSVESGAVATPYKTISGAIAGFNASIYVAIGVTFYIAPGSYSEAADITFPNVSTTIQGNNVMVTMAVNKKITFPSTFDVYSFNMSTSGTGGVFQTDTSTSSIHNIQDGVITGSLTTSGLCTLTNQVVTGAISNLSTGTLYISSSTCQSTVTNSTSTLNIGGSAINGRIINSGTLHINGVAVTVSDNSNYAITSTAGGSVIYMAGDVVINTGTGGGINCANGATTTPNEISSIDVIVGVGTVNTINTGTAVTLLANYTANTVAGTTIYASGSAINGGIFGALDNMGTYKDSSHSVGTAGQFLKSTATGTAWIGAPVSGVTKSMAGSGTDTVDLTDVPSKRTVDAIIDALKAYGILS